MELNWPALPAIIVLLGLLAFAYQPEKRFLEGLDDRERKVQNLINWLIIVPMFLLLLALFFRVYALGPAALLTVTVAFGLWLILVAWNLLRRYRLLQDMVRLKDEEVEEFRETMLRAMEDSEDRRDGGDSEVSG